MNYPDDYINEIICGDCLEVMKGIPDGSVDLVLTDPPYGKKWGRGLNGIGVVKYKNEIREGLEWDNLISIDYFQEIFRISKNQIIFGANYYWSLFPSTNCFLIWEKLGDFKRGKQVPFSPVEMAWTSFKCVPKRYVRVVQGFYTESKDQRVHPTQKPSELFIDILNDFSKENDLILDPFLGSGTTAVVCKQLGRRFIGIEINPDYCKIAEQRLAQEILI